MRKPTTRPPIAAPATAPGLMFELFAELVGEVEIPAAEGLVVLVPELDVEAPVGADELVVRLAEVVDAKEVEVSITVVKVWKSMIEV